MISTLERDANMTVWACALLVAGSVACGADAPPPPRPPPTPVPTPAAPQEPADGPGHSTGTSYDDALSVPEDMESVAGERELTNAELAQPMRSPAFLSACGTPDTMKVTIRVVIRDGAAIGVTVRTVPDDATVAECIDKGVRGLAWPPTKRRDSMTTAF